LRDMLNNVPYIGEVVADTAEAYVAARKGEDVHLYEDRSPVGQASELTVNMLNRIVTLAREKKEPRTELERANQDRQEQRNIVNATLDGYRLASLLTGGYMPQGLITQIGGYVGRELTLTNAELAKRAKAARARGDLKEESRLQVELRRRRKEGGMSENTIKAVERQQRGETTGKSRFTTVK